MEKKTPIMLILKEKKYMLPIDTHPFWKERIDSAKKQNRLHFSVYIASQNLWDKIFEAHKKILEKETKPGEGILDAGCGYGRMSELFSPADYVGVDFSPDFIQEARKLYPDKIFIQGDLKKLPFEDKEFDVGFCISIKAMVISNLDVNTWNLMAAELKRVCKRVLILEYGNADDRNYLELAAQYETL